MNDADAAFCEQLYQDYLNDQDPDKDEGTPLEDCKREWGQIYNVIDRGGDESESKAVESMQG